jgi:hypothetical protein
MDFLSRRHWYVIVCALFVGGCATVPPPQSETGHSIPEQTAVVKVEVGEFFESPALHALRLTQEGTELCKAQTITREMFVERDGRIVLRPVILCAYSEKEGRWHVIHARMTHFTKADWAQSQAWRESRFAIESVTPGGYRISRVPGSGFGVSRLSVSVDLSDEHLTVYRIRHAWFERGTFVSGDTDDMFAHMKVVDLTPSHPDFLGKGLDTVAVEWILKEIDGMREDLDQRNVASSVFPEKKLTEVIHPLLLAAVPVIEHTDQDAFMGATACRRSNGFDTDEERDVCVEDAHQRAIEGTLVVYALNKGHSNKYSASSAGASGAWQFMNSKNTPTYDRVREACPAAGLDPSFSSGTKDFANGGKAAMCLLDLNLGYLPEIRELYERNPLLAGIYLLAAYNGGPRWARELFNRVHEKHPELEMEDIVFPTTLRIASEVRVRKSSAPGAQRTSRKGSFTRISVRMNGETPGYVTKFLYFLDYLKAMEERENGN